MEGEIIEAQPSGKWKLAIVLLPTFLLLSAAGAVWFHWHEGRETNLDARLALQSTALNAKEVQGHMSKLTTYIGPRGWDSEEGIKGLRRTLAYIEGTLSPQNYGFQVHRANNLSLNGDLWPILWVDLVPEEGVTNWMVVRVNYDGEPEDLAIVLAVLNELREVTMPRGIRFVFAENFNARVRGERLEGEEEAMKVAGLDTSIIVRGLDKEERVTEIVIGNFEADLESERLPAGELGLFLEGAGEKLNDEALLVRARWFRDFVRKAAHRP